MCGCLDATCLPSLSGCELLQSAPASMICLLSHYGFPPILSSLCSSPSGHLVLRYHLVFSYRHYHNFLYCHSVFIKVFATSLPLQLACVLSMDKRHAGMISGIVIGGALLIVIGGWVCYKGAKRIQDARTADEEKELHSTPQRYYPDLPIRIEE